MLAKSIGVAVGGLTNDGTGAAAVVTSLTDTEIFLTVNGVAAGSVVPTKIGDDRGAVETAGYPNADLNTNTWAFYAGSIVITGLSPLTKNTWVATQGSNSETGTFYSNTNTKGSKFSLAFTTCFAPNRSVDVTAWDFLSWYIDNTNFPLVACMHQDDIYYPDGFQGLAQSSNPLGAYKNSQGKLTETYDSAPNAIAANQSGYGYGLHYGIWFGVLDTFYNAVDFDAGNLSSPKANAADNEGFRYCMSNMAIMPQWGDHEFYDQFPNPVDIDAGGNPYHDTIPNAGHTSGYDGRAYIIYEALMKPLQGTTARNADADSNHWYTDFGCFKYISCDPITKSSYAVRTFGTDQINDILTIADGDQWFTCIGSSMDGVSRGIPNMVAADVGSTISYKENNPIGDVEYQLMWVDEGNTPQSLMDNPRTNGVLGSTLMLRGDWHDASWFLWGAPSDEFKASTAKESFHEVGLATVNNSSNQGGDDWNQDLTAMETLDFASLIGAISENKTNGQMVMTIIEVDGTKGTPEIVIKQWDICEIAGSGENLKSNFMFDGEEQLDKAGNLWKMKGSRRIVRFAGDSDGYDLDDDNIFQVPKTTIATDE